MTEGKIYRCFWKRIPTGYRVWLEADSSIAAEHTDFEAADELLYERIMEATGDGENQHQYEPPPPDPAGASGRGRLWLLGQEGDVTMSHEPPYFEGGLCDQCVMPLGPRTSLPLEVSALKGGGTLPTIAPKRSHSMLREMTRAILPFLLAGCTWLEDPTKYREKQRMPSPDGKLDAVVVEDGGDATTGLFYDVFVVRHGASLPHWKADVVAVLEWPYLNDTTVGLKPRWRGNDTLALEFQRATRQRLERPEVRGSNGPIAVVLARGVVDSTPPVGRRAVSPRK